MKTENKSNKKVAGGKPKKEVVEEEELVSCSGSQLSNAEELLEDVENSVTGSEEEKTDSMQDDQSTPDEDEEVKRTIFIKGIDYDLREEDIKKHLQKLGEIIRVTVPLTYDQKRNKGFAYVEYKKVGDAEKALKLNGTELLGREVLVAQARAKENKKIYTVFVKNLNYETTKEEIKEHFSKYGTVYNVSIPTDDESRGRNKGYCFVEYNDAEAVQKALKGNNILNDRKLYLNEGEKNEDRNNRRSNDRLYGRRDDDEDRRGSRRGGDRKFGRRDDEEGRRGDGRRFERRGDKFEKTPMSKKSNKTVFRDEDSE